MRTSSRISVFLRSGAGNVAIISGLMLPVLIGLAGLGFETSYWYYRQRDLQGAADIAAYGGALVLKSGGNTTEVKTAATGDAVTNGWRQADGTIVVNVPPTSGSYKNNTAVEVLLTQNEPRFLTQIYFGDTTVPINVRAVASYTPDGPACFLSLHPTQYHAMEFWGNSDARFNGCNVVSNSTDDAGFAVGGAAFIQVPCVRSAGGSSVSATLILTECPSVSTKVLPTPDPYEDLPEPPEADEPCITGQPVGNVYSPGRYCDGLQVNSNATFLPGNYVIESGAVNGLRFGAQANVTANGAMFYLTDNAVLTSNGGARLNMSAQTSGVYSGIMFFSDRTNTYQNNTFNGDASSVVTGALYFPSQHVRFLGNFGGANGCMQLVASTIQYTGNTTFSTDCASAGLEKIPTFTGIALVE